MGHTPSVLSVGMRCMEQGCWFLWLPGVQQCVVTPDLAIIVCDVVKDVPYIRAETLYDMPRGRNEVLRLTGVEITRGRVRLVSPCDVAAAASASPGACEPTATDIDEDPRVIEVSTEAPDDQDAEEDEEESEGSD